MLVGPFMLPTLIGWVLVLIVVSNKSWSKPENLKWFLDVDVFDLEKYAKPMHSNQETFLRLLVGEQGRAKPLKF